MRKRLGVAAWALICAAPLAARADEGFTFTGSLRGRYEGLTGQPRAGLSRNADLYTTRLTLEAGYDAGPWRVGAELQDARAFGGTARGGLTSNDVDAAELVQAYVAADVKTPLGPGEIQLGRFVVPMLGTRRLVSAGDDRNATTGFTGVRFDTHSETGLAVHLIYAAPQRRLPDDVDAVRHNGWAVDKESLKFVLWGGGVETPRLIDGVDAGMTFIGLDEEDTASRATRDRRLRTVDVRLVHAAAPGGIDLEAEGAYQFGEASETAAPAAVPRKVSSFFAHLEAGRALGFVSEGRLSLLADVASGDHGRGRFNRFDTLFGMRRGDFGPGGLYQAVGRANLISTGLRFDAEPNRRTELMVAWRSLWLASTSDAFSTTGVRDPTGRSGRYAGQQVNARLRYWLAPERLRLEVDSLVLFKGRFWKTAPNAASRADTRYLSLAVTASF
jgi:hypothetical protein